MQEPHFGRKSRLAKRAAWLSALVALPGAVFAQSTCVNSNTQAGQANAAAMAEISDMESAGKFVFGTVMNLSGAGTVIDTFSQALTKGLSGTDVVTAQLGCQQAEIAAIQTELSTLQTEINSLSKVIAGIGNTTLQNVILTDLDTVLKPALAQLNPNGGQRSLAGAQYAPGRNLWGNTGTPVAASTNPPVDRATAQNVANIAQGVADLYMNSFDSRWIAFDIVKDSGTSAPTPTFEPYPALSVYFLALQIWMTAISIEEMQPGATFASIRTTGNFQDLALHRAFLHRMGDGGVGVASQYLPDKLPLPDLINSRINCVWNPVSQYPPPKSNTCEAVPSCTDGIQRKTWNKANALPGWNVSQTYSFTVGTGQWCSFNPARNPQIDMQASVANLYGADTVSKMQTVVDFMYSTGHMAAVQQNGSFSGSNVQLTTAYAVDRNGNVFRFTENGSQSLSAAQQVATGWNDARALLPGGGGVFYTVSNAGVLAWRSFDNVASTPAGPGAPQGPVQLASNFGRYSAVFGGSDGVIYAVGADGSLNWYRHTNLSGGGGPAYLTGPKVVGSGWGQYKQLLSGGNGVVYAVQADGTLLWFHHKDYLTGDSMDAAGTAQSGLAPALQKRALTAQAHWDGPIKINSGWTNLLTAQAGPNGTILTVRSDGTVLWYQYANYLTGGASASSVPLTPPVQGAMTAATVAPSWGAPPATSMSTNHITPLSRPALTTAPVSSFSANTRPTPPPLGMAPTFPQTPISATSASAALPVNGWQGPKSVASGWQQYPLVSLTLYTTSNPVIK